MKCSRFMSGALCCVGILVLTWCGCHSSGECASNEVRVSSFGYDSVDSTRFIQAALDSGASRVILDRQDGPWPSLTLKIRSNTEFVLEPGVELQAKRGAFKGLRDYLFVVDGVTNVIIRGGKDSAFRMWKSDYSGKDYRHSEWRYALRIVKSKNVLVEGLRICDSGGDGIGVSGCDITVRDCVCDNNYRQGMSIFSVENLCVENCVFSGTSGTAPAAGIDVEPDLKGQGLRNCVIRNCQFLDNQGCGVELHLAQLNGDSDPVSVAVEDSRFRGNVTAISVLASGAVSNFVRGCVKFSNCKMESPRLAGIEIRGKPADAFDLSFNGCVISNAPTALSVAATDFRQPMVGNVEFNDIAVHKVEGNAWFSQGLPGTGLVRGLRGSVRVFDEKGHRQSIVLDEDWISENLQPLNGGRALPERRGLPSADSVQLVDLANGRLIALPNIMVLRNARYVFFVERPCEVEFVGRLMMRRRGKDLKAKPITIERIASAAIRERWEIKCPGLKSSSLRFHAPEAGFYSFVVPAVPFHAFMLEKASVPVAIDVTEAPVVIGSICHGEIHSLWMWRDANELGWLVAKGAGHSKFKATMLDPEGRRRAQSEGEVGHFAVELKDAAPGLWQLDFLLDPHAPHDVRNVELVGVQSVLFLSNEKFWKPRKDAK